MPLLTPDHPDWPKLFKPSAPVTDYETQVRPFLPEMIRLIERKRAIGGYAMSGCQIGAFHRFFIFGGRHFKKSKIISVVINPTNIQHGGQMPLEQEMCMSFLNRWVDVPRWESISFDCVDQFGNERQYEAEGFLARVFQHELDHLDGVCIINEDGTPQGEEKEIGGPVGAM